jgi:hypothetical protein
VQRCAIVSTAVEVAGRLAMPLTPRIGGGAHDSQCSLDGAGKSASGPTNTLTVGVALTFTTAFDDGKNVH